MRDQALEEGKLVKRSLSLSRGIASKAPTVSKGGWFGRLGCILEASDNNEHSDLVCPFATAPTYLVGIHFLVASNCSASRLDSSSEMTASNFGRSFSSSLEAGIEVSTSGWSTSKGKAHSFK